MQTKAIISPAANGGTACPAPAELTRTVPCTNSTPCQPTSSSPIANAGSNEQSVIAGERVTLDGSNSSDPDGDIVSYLWEQLGSDSEGVTINNTDKVIANFLAPGVSANGISLHFLLTVTDSQNNIDTDQITVHITSKNMPPTANAGPDQNVFEDTLVILDGTGSSDLENNHGGLTYRWTQTAGEHVRLSGANTATPSFMAPAFKSARSTLIFALEVRDSGGLLAKDKCTVNIVWDNDPPVADAGKNQTVSQGERVTLDGSASWDPDGAIKSYLWKQVSGATVHLDNSNAARTKFTAPEMKKSTKLEFELTVADEEGLKSADACMINVINNRESQNEHKNKDTDAKR
jgi:chitodextrinase